MRAPVLRDDRLREFAPDEHLVFVAVPMVLIVEMHSASTVVADEQHV